MMICDNCGKDFKYDIPYNKTFIAKMINLSKAKHHYCSKKCKRRHWYVNHREYEIVKATLWNGFNYERLCVSKQKYWLSENGKIKANMWRKRYRQKLKETNPNKYWEQADRKNAERLYQKIKQGKCTLRSVLPYMLR